MPWRSVTVPIMLPKPDVVALTGGYRRTPFMQIGADIYCDSALMCRVIDRLAPEPPLYPASRAGPGGDRRAMGRPVAVLDRGAVHDAARRRAAHLRRRAARGREGLRRRPRGDDRRHAGGRPCTTQAAHCKRYLGRLEHMLADDRPFLLGALPSIADFSAAQSIWFVRRAPPVAAHPREPTGASTAWYERVHGLRPWRVEPMTSAEAIALAQPRRPSFAPCCVDAERRPRRRARRSASRRPTTRTTRSSARWSALDADEVVVERERRARRHRPRAFPAHRLPRQGSIERRTRP